MLVLKKNGHLIFRKKSAIFVNVKKFGHSILRTFNMSDEVWKMCDFWIFSKKIDRGNPIENVCFLAIFEENR